MSTSLDFQLMRLELRHLIDAPAMLHDRPNVDGIALAAQLNAKIRDEGLGTNGVAVERLLGLVSASQSAAATGFSVGQQMVEVPLEAAEPGVILVDFDTGTDAFRDPLQRDASLQGVLGQVKDWIESGMQDYATLKDCNGVELGFAVHGQAETDLPTLGAGNIRLSIDVVSPWLNNVSALERGESPDEAWADTLTDLSGFVGDLMANPDPEAYRFAAEEDGAHALNIEFPHWTLPAAIVSLDSLPTLAEEAMHKAIAHIQAGLGLVPGSAEANESLQYFASEQGDQVQAIFNQYIDYEQLFSEPRHASSH